MNMFLRRARSKSKKIELPVSNSPHWKNIKNNVSFGLSILAILLSSSTFYYDNLLVDEDLLVKASFLDILSVRDSSVKTDSLLITLMYNNRGNRQVTVTNPYYFYQVSGRNEGLVGSDMIFPFRLEAREIKFIHIRIPFPIIKGHVKKRLSTYSKDSISYASLGLVYFAIDSKGKQRAKYEKYINTHLTDRTFALYETGFANSLKDDPIQLFD